MTNGERARQFAPFDSLKGLHDALRLKEYEHERIEKGDLPQEKIEEISNTILKLNKNQMVEITYFYDGYYKKTVGKSRVNFLENYIQVNNFKINFDDIYNIVVCDEIDGWNAYWCYLKKSTMFMSKYYKFMSICPTTIYLFKIKYFNWKNLFVKSF